MNRTRIVESFFNAKNVLAQIKRCVRKYYQFTNITVNRVLNVESHPQIKQNYPDIMKHTSNFVFTGAYNLKRHEKGKHLANSFFYFMFSYESSYFRYHMRTYVLKCLILLYIDRPVFLAESTFPAITLLILCSIFRFIGRSCRSFVFVMLCFWCVFISDFLLETTVGWFLILLLGWCTNNPLNEWREDTLWLLFILW